MIILLKIMNNPPTQSKGPSVQIKYFRPRHETLTEPLSTNSLPSAYSPWVALYTQFPTVLSQVKMIYIASFKTKELTGAARLHI